MGLTDDEAAELAVLERQLFAGSVAVSDAQIARYDVLRDKKLTGSDDVVHPREGGAASMGGADSASGAPTDASSTVPDDTRDDHNEAATSEAVGDSAEPSAAELDPVGIAQRLKDWVAQVRRVPIRRRLALIGWGSWVRPRSLQASLAMGS